MAAGIKRFAAGIVFLCILIGIMINLGNICTFTGGNCEKNYWKMFYSLKDEPLNMTIIGSSAVYMFYNYAQAYEEQKLRTAMISNSAQPCETVPYIIDEIESINSPELIVVELRTLLKDSFVSDNSSEAKSYRILKTLMSMRFLSPHRIRGVIDLLSEDKNRPFIEYLIPLLQEHEKVYTAPIREFFAGVEFNFENYPPQGQTAKIRDVSEQLEKMKREEPSGDRHLDEESKNMIDEIAEKASSHGVKLLFILTPYVHDADVSAVACEMKDYMAEKGYDFLNCEEHIEEIGLDFSSDYADLLHTNAVGAHKFTSWFVKYLTEHYEFSYAMPDKTELKWKKLADNWHETYLRYEKEAEKNQRALS